MNRWLLAAALALIASSAYAQVDHAQVVAVCGTLPQAYPTGVPQPMTQDVNGNQCSNATFSGTVTVSGAVTQGAKGTDAAADSWYVQPGTGATFPVTGTFWQATQPISVAALPLPSGAATAALQTTGNTALTTINTTLNSPMQNSGGSVTANAGTNLNTSALALDASVSGLSLGQASTTSGQKGVMVQCAVTTASPTYTTAQTDPLSCDTTGALRITAPAASPVNVNVTTPPNDIIAGPTSFTSPGTLVVSSQGAGSVGIQATGTGAGLVFSFQGTDDGTNWFTVNTFTQAGTVVTGGTANGNWIVPAGGYRSIRVNLTAISSGTETFTLNASAGSTQHPITSTGVSSNLTGINGVAPVVGNGVTGTGSQRVTIASDNTPFSVKVDQTTPGTTNAVSIAQIGATTVVNGGLAGTLGVGGATATNVAITDNPLNLGAQAVSSENTAVTTARKVQLVATLTGKQITQPYANPENYVNGTTAAITDTTSTSTIASAGGSLRNYITQCTVTNSHATVGTFVKILDGSTIIHEGYAAAVGGGFAASFPVPLRGTAATAVNCQPVTTGANVICSCSGYTGT